MSINLLPARRKSDALRRVALVVTRPRSVVDVWIGNECHPLVIPDRIENSLGLGSYWSARLKGDAARAVAGVGEVEISFKVFEDAVEVTRRIPYRRMHDRAVVMA